MQLLFIPLVLLYLFILFIALCIFPYLAFTVQKDNKNTGFFGRYSQDHTFTLPQTAFLYTENFYAPLQQMKLISTLSLTNHSLTESPNTSYQAIKLHSLFGKYTIVLMDVQTIKIIGQAKYPFEKGFSRFSSTKWCFVSLYHILVEYIHSGFVTPELQKKIKKYKRISALTSFVRFWIWVISVIFILLSYLISQMG